MARDPIHTGYARALFEMARAESATDRVEEELIRLRDLLKRSPELLQFLKDPNIKHEGKRQALAELFQGRIHPILLTMLITLSDQDRIGHLPHIIEEFSAIAAAARQKVTGEITSAIPLDEPTVQRFAAELSRLTGKNVQLIPRVDPGIVGGAIIKVGEQILDGSLRRKLDQIQERLAQ